MSFDFGGKRALVTGAGKGERFSMRMCWIGNCRVCMGTLAVARLYKVFHHTKGVWDMDIEQFVAIADSPQVLLWRLLLLMS